jgi:hypothetical protein
VQPVFDTIVSNAVRLCGAIYGMIWLRRRLTSPPFQAEGL